MGTPRSHRHGNKSSLKIRTRPTRSTEWNTQLLLRSPLPYTPLNCSVDKRIIQRTGMIFFAEQGGITTPLLTPS